MVAELEVRFDEVAFFTGAVDADSAGGEEEKEMLEETLADVVAEGDGGFEAICTV